MRESERESVCVCASASVRVRVCVCVNGARVPRRVAGIEKEESEKRSYKKN